MAYQTNQQVTGSISHAADRAASVCLHNGRTTMGDPTRAGRRHERDAMPSESAAWAGRYAVHVSGMSGRSARRGTRRILGR